MKLPLVRIPGPAIRRIFATPLFRVFAVCLVIVVAGSVAYAYNQSLLPTPISAKDSNESSAQIPPETSSSADSKTKSNTDRTSDKKTDDKKSAPSSPTQPTSTGSSNTSESDDSPISSPSKSDPAPSPTGFKANCINVPSSCGYPDTTNTGVPAGTSLSNSGSITVTTDGAVIQNLNVSGQIAVRADNVTIKNTRITSSDYYPIDYDGHTGLLVQDSEIYGTTTAVTAGMSFANYTARRVYVHGTVDGFKADANVLIEDCYVSGLRYDSVYDTHNDGLQTTGGSNVTVRHNTFKLGAINGISSVIQIGTEWGPNSNWLVTNNLIDGGGWSINAQSDSAGSNRVFSNNRFTRRHGFGVGDVPFSVWTGNYYDDDNTPISG